MFESLDEFLDGRCPLKVSGRTYYVPEPTAREGIRLQRMFANPETYLTDAQELKEIRALLGPVWEQLIIDKVGFTKAVFLGRVAMIHYAIGPQAAKNYMAGGIDDPGNPLPRKWRISRFRGLMARGTQVVVRGMKK